MKADYKRLLLAALDLKGWDGPAAVAAGLTSAGYQISEQTMTNWKSRGISSIGYRKAAPIIGCRPAWIETGEGEMKDIAPDLAMETGKKFQAQRLYDGLSTEIRPKNPVLSNVTAGPDVRGYVPLISWVQAGMWQDVIDNLAPGDGERIETTYRPKEHTYALRVRGDSMEPIFPDGAILIVEPDESPEPGKYVIVRQNGDSEATFKQLIQDGGTLFLKPLNPRYPIMELRQDAVFCGVVKRIEMDV